MFIITILLAIMGLIGTDIYVPSLPHIAAMFHQSQNHAQLTISLFLASFALSQLFYGPISDYVGRRSPLIFGVVIFIMGSIICISAQTFYLLCVGRIIQGLGVGAGLSLARVILRDCYQNQTLAIKTSQVAIFISLTPAIAPLLGGVLQQKLGSYASFYFLLGYGMLLFLLLTFVFKETIQTKNTHFKVKTIFREYITLLQNGVFIRYAMIAGLAFSAIILYANIMPFIVENQLKLSAGSSGFVLFFAALGLSLGSWLSSRIVRQIMPQRLIQVGLMTFTVTGLLLTLSDYLIGTNLICLMSLVFLITLGCGFIFPNALAHCFSQIKYNIGIAGAIYGSIQIFISMLVNLLLNNIVHQGQLLLGLLYFAIGLAGLVLQFVKIPQSN